MFPSVSSLSRWMRAGSYGPMTSVLRHVGSVSVPDTTYLVVSLKNGAPGSSSAVRVDHAGSNISYVVRPSRMPRQRAVKAPMASPILGSKPYSNVQVGASITPSRLMNSCTLIAAMCYSRVDVDAVTTAPARRCIAAPAAARCNRRRRRHRARAGARSGHGRSRAVGDHDQRGLAPDCCRPGAAGGAETDGAKRARTADLLGAIQALSQAPTVSLREPCRS